MIDPYMRTHKGGYAAMCKTCRMGSGMSIGAKGHVVGSLVWGPIEVARGWWDGHVKQLHRGEVR